MKMKKVEMKIEGMMCPHCEARVKAALEAARGVEAADVSYETGRAEVTLFDGTDEEILEKIVTDAGYTVIK